MNNKSASLAKVRVWDIPTRLFHWSIVVLFVFLILTGENGDWLERHMQAGYLLSGLVMFRILWGFLGSYHARFATFLRSPIVAARYALNLFTTGRIAHYHGHNPAGSYMVVLLLLALLLQAAAGLVTTDDIFWAGPFYDSVPDSVAKLGATIHRTFPTYLQMFVLVHIVAVLYHKFRFREALMMAMVHGKKNVELEQGKKLPDLYDGVSIPKLIVSLLFIAVWLGWLFSKPL